MVSHGGLRLFFLLHTALADRTAGTGIFGLCRGGADGAAGLREEISRHLPEGVPHVFISSVTGQGLTELKDMLWREITDERNRIEVSPITHRPLDGHHRVREEDEFIFQNVPAMPGEDDEEPFDDDFEGEDYGYGMLDEDDPRDVDDFA